MAGGTANHARRSAILLSPGLIATALTMRKAVFRLALRQTEGLIRFVSDRAIELD